MWEKMSQQLSAEKPPSSATNDRGWWRFTWEAQSHTSILRLLLFNPSTNPSTQCRDLKVVLLPQKSLLTVSFSEAEDQIGTSVRVPVPRVLIDSESPIHFRLFDDHIDVKLALLLPVDHPLVSDFDSILNGEENGDVLRPFSVDSDLKKLSCTEEEVHFYCRNCSSKLTKGLRSFREMPSVNWRDAADNWFGNCCCSFGGASEKLVAEYVKSFTCVPGVCLLNATSVLLSKNDILGCEFPDVPTKQNFEPDRNPPNGTCSSRVSSNGVCEKAEAVPEDNKIGNVGYKTSEDLVDDESLSHTLNVLQINDNKGLMSENVQNSHIGCCTPAVSETSSKLQINEGGVEFLENQKMFADGYLGNGFMVRSSELSKDIRWITFLCPKCSCLVGAYPCFDDNVPLDGGIRLFKCYVSTGSDDAFGNYTLERMFASQILENAEDELTFRTIVRDIQTKSPALQIVVLNPNSWVCSGSLNPEEVPAQLVMHPVIKLLFSSSSQGMEFDSRSLDEWVRKNQADEIYMFSYQINELVRVLDLAKSLSPPSCQSLQGLLLSSMKR